MVLPPLPFPLRLIPYIYIYIYIYISRIYIYCCFQIHIHKIIYVSCWICLSRPDLQTVADDRTHSLVMDKASGYEYELGTNVAPLGNLVRLLYNFHPYRDLLSEKSMLSLPSSDYFSASTFPPPSSSLCLSPFRSHSRSPSLFRFSSESLQIVCVGQYDI